MQNMTKFSTLWVYAMVIAITLSSCELAGGIFKAGFYTAIIVIVLVIVIIIWLVRKCGVDQPPLTGTPFHPSGISPQFCRQQHCSIRHGTVTL
jgi:hypothetical protein